MTEELTIQLEETDTKGRFYVPGSSDEGDAEMTFSKTGELLIIIDHTFVPEEFKGTGLGVRLVEAGIEYARSKNKKIVPLCPFAAAQFRKHAEWHDVLNK